jgi:hypothetical protein
MPSRVRLILVVLLAVVAAAAPLVWRGWPRGTSGSSTRSTGSEGDLAGRPLPPLDAAEGWLNGGPVAGDSLAGGPAVVVLWRDTDPASVRAALRAQAWHAAYRRYGVHVVGLHVPEFAFAAETSQVARETRRLGLTFPQALDPSLGLWSRFGGRPLPRLLLVDPSGTVIEDAGADGVTRLEHAIRAAIRRSHPEVAFPADPGSMTEEGPGGTPPPIPTVFLGSTRVARGPLANAPPGREQIFTAQFRNQIEGEPFAPYPVGRWRLGAEGARAGRGGAENYLALRYDAGALGAVMSPPAGSAVRVWILRDERWLGPDELGADARLDGRGASYVDVDAPRLYALCTAAPGQHVVKLSPEVPGLTVHALTFDRSEAGEPPRP